MLRGNFNDGWRAYEWRRLTPEFASFRREFPEPRWTGDEDIRGKRILLHAEQGLGDTIQFCRYARQVAELGAHVIMEVPGTLIPLFRGLEGVHEWVAAGQPLPQFDIQCPLLSLPLAFGTTLDTLPGARSYLSADALKVRAWQARLGEGQKPRIGLAWSGNDAHKNDRNRSILLAALLPFLPEAFDCFSLHKEIRAADRQVLEQSGRIKTFCDELTDFSDTAALVECMDIVVSVDTSVAHLSGALGKPTWVLLPYVPDWRWMLERTDSPWYPAMRLFRQQAIGDWEGAFAKLRDALLGLPHSP